MFKWKWSHWIPNWDWKWVNNNWDVFWWEFVDWVANWEGYVKISDWMEFKWIWENGAEITAKWSQWDGVKIDNSKKIRIINSSGSWDPDIKDVVLMQKNEQKQYQKLNYKLTHRDLIAKIKEKYPYKLRSWINNEIKKYQNNLDYAFACSWETQIMYKAELVDIIWQSFPDNPRLEHLKPKD